MRRSLFAATLGVAACGQKAPRIGAVRIGAAPYDDYYPDEPMLPDAGTEMPVEGTDAAPAVAPGADAGAAAAAADAAAAVEVPDRPPPVRIGAAEEPIEEKREPIRIGARKVPNSSTGIRGSVVDADGHPLANASLRIELASGTRIVATDAAGVFALEGVAPGEHTAVVRARGFAPVHARLTAARTAGDAVLTLAPADE